ncbi:MAG: acyl-CoA thioesterase [Deltaproteobacteria bacterium]|nr:acyl-CoA thioesterase [Deltaproteobacteria bacterium]
MRFQLPITASDADIDELDHVSNLVYLRWVLEVAMEHSRAKGWDHPQYRALGSVFIVRRHELDYLAPVLRGELVIAETWVASWKGASCVRATEIKRGEQVVLRAATTWAFVSLTSGRPQRIPEELLAAFV